MRWFVEMCRRRGLKVNAGKSRVMVLSGEEGLECEVCVYWVRLDHAFQFKYLGCVLDESGTYEAECSREVASERRLQLLLDLWLMVGVCTLSVLESCLRHCSCL